MRIVRNLDEGLWRDFVDRHPQGNIFHTPEMFEVFVRARGHRPSLWATVDESGYPLALLLPVQVTLMGGLLRRFTTRAVAYGSVLCAPGPEGEQALDVLLQAYENGVEGAPLFTELRNLADLSGLQPVLNANGFAYEEHLDFLIDLTRSPEEIMQGIGSRTRKNLRRGLRRGEVDITEVDRREQVTACYELLSKTYAAAEVPLADSSLFEAAFDVLYPRGMVKILLAQVNNAYAAGSLELVYKDTIYGWYGGLDRAYGEYIPNELLVWYILRWGAENGYRVYDFGGAGKPDEEYGVRDFKAKFGGQLVNFGRNVHVHSRLTLTVSRVGYQVYRKLS